jgi:hypothetical protein
MGVRRRDVLKAVAAPFVVGALGVSTARRDTPSESTLAIAKGEIAMNSRPLMTVRIATAPFRKVGTVPHGIRSVVPVTGGDFEGPQLRGKVLPGGSDWLLLRPDGVLELDLRIALETNDHALISMTFQGLRHGPPDVIAAVTRGEVVEPARYYFRTLPRFEASTKAYGFLNRIVTVGVGEARPDGAVHRIDEIL